MDGSVGVIRRAEFKADLEYSLEARESEFFDEFYRRVFPGVASIRIVSDRGLQRKGVDKEIVLQTGRLLWVDEKKRKKWYGDILIEWEHRYPSGYIKLGWGQLPLECDYIVYAFPSARVAYLLPLPLLRMALAKRGAGWVAEYGLKGAVNRDYVTMNIPVPKDVLLDALQAEFTQEFGDA